MRLNSQNSWEFEYFTVTVFFLCTLVLCTLTLLREFCLCSSVGGHVGGRFVNTERLCTSRGCLTIVQIDLERTQPAQEKELPINVDCPLVPLIGEQANGFKSVPKACTCLHLRLRKALWWWQSVFLLLGPCHL